MVVTPPAIVSIDDAIEALETTGDLFVAGLVDAKTARFRVERLTVAAELLGERTLDDCEAQRQFDVVRWRLARRLRGSR